MSTLHTVNKSPFATRTLLSCLNHVSAGDSILLIEDGVYGALMGSEISKNISDKSKGFSIFVLAPDMKARGLSEDKLIEGIEPVDYASFVDMAAKHDLNQAWL